MQVPMKKNGRNYYAGHAAGSLRLLLLAVVAVSLLAFLCGCENAEGRREDDKRPIRRYPRNSPSNWEKKSYGS